MKNTKQAFTMIEMVFVIVVLGILSAVAVPMFTKNKADATIAKGRADVASIRSSIITERQSRLLTGDSDYITAAALDSGGLFGGVLMYPISSSSGDNGWSGTAGSGTYIYKIAGNSNTFTYTSSNGKFLCTSGSYCSKLTD